MPPVTSLRRCDLRDRKVMEKGAVGGCVKAVFVRELTLLRWYRVAVPKGRK